MPRATQNFNILLKYKSLFLKYKFPFTLGVLALFATNMAGAMIPGLIENAIDLLNASQSQSPQAVGISGTTLEAFEMLLFQMLGFAVLVFAARLLSRYWIIGAGQQLEYDLRNLVYQHLLKMPSSFYSAHPSGELMSRITNDVEAMRMMIGGGLMLGFNTLFVYVTTLPMMLKISPVLTLLTFILYPVGIFLLSKLSGQVKGLYYQVQKTLGEISATIQENFTGIAVIQAYVKEDVENQRIKNQSRQYFKAYKNLIQKRVVLMMIFVILGGLGYLAVLSFGGWQVIDHKISLGAFIAFTLYLERIAWPTASMGWTISTVQQGTAALTRVDDILSLEPTIVSPENPTPLPATMDGKITIANLSFAYNTDYKTSSSNDDETSNASESLTSSDPFHPFEQKASKNVAYVLKNINLVIEPGHTVAVVGPIGSGKSTLLRLIPRLLETPANTIFLDEIDITTLSLSDLRRQVALMPQQSYLFSTSVAANIAFQTPETFEQIKDNLVLPITETASIHQEIQAMLRQYDTTVGERGVMLSGGQRQRVSLARTLLQSRLLEASILVLDDPFSQVDAGTEENIIEALDTRKLFENKTTLIATHRMSMVQKADWVILMNHGEVVATGTHDDLMTQQPLYQQLHRQDELRKQSDSVVMDDDDPINTESLL